MQIDSSEVGTFTISMEDTVAKLFAKLLLLPGLPLPLCLCAFFASSQQFSCRWPFLPHKLHFLGLLVVFETQPATAEVVQLEIDLGLYKDFEFLVDMSKPDMEVREVVIGAFDF